MACCRAGLLLLPLLVLLLLPVALAAAATAAAAPALAAASSEVWGGSQPTFGCGPAACKAERCAPAVAFPG